jgi:hypothetical protein
VEKNEVKEHMSQPIQREIFHNQAEKFAIRIEDAFIALGMIQAPSEHFLTQIVHDHIKHGQNHPLRKQLNDFLYEAVFIKGQRAEEVSTELKELRDFLTFNHGALKGMDASADDDVLDVLFDDLKEELNNFLTV